MSSIEQGSSGNLTSLVTNGVNVLPYSIVGSGVQTVTTAGTRVALASTTAIKSVTVRAKSVNTGLIYVGSSIVASSNGFQLSSGETVSIDIDNLSKVYIDSAVNEEGVSFIYLS